jgi:hypothetical protein
MPRPTMSCMSDVIKGFRVFLRGGPADGRRETFPRRPDSIGYGDARGIYVRSDVVADGWLVYEWLKIDQDLTPDVHLTD